MRSLVAAILYKRPSGKAPNNGINGVQFPRAGNSTVANRTRGMHPNPGTDQAVAFHAPA
jgi:hypothetical protein